MAETSDMPKMVAADITERGRVYYLVNAQYDFIDEVKTFLDWKAATKRAHQPPKPTALACCGITASLHNAA
jgi:hypothetical protein